MQEHDQALQWKNYRPHNKAVRVDWRNSLVELIARGMFAPGWTRDDVTFADVNYVNPDAMLDFARAS